MRKKIVAVFLAWLVASTLFAQTPAPPAPAARPAPRATPAPPAPLAEEKAPAPATRGQSVNIKVEVAISDQRGGQAPIKKTVVAVIGDMARGSVRSSATIDVPGQAPFEAPLNLDANPTILPDGKIRLVLNFQYDLPGFNVSPSTPDRPSSQPAVRRGAVSEGLTMILESGKPLVVSQSADAVLDRQVSVEVKATIMR